MYWEIDFLRACFGFATARQEGKFNEEAERSRQLSAVNCSRTKSIGKALASKLRHDS